jgi:hypothetical protein
VGNESVSVQFAATERKTEWTPILPASPWFGGRFPDERVFALPNHG